MGRGDREVLIVEQERGGGLGWALFGAALGAGLALLFAPRTGRETRKELRRGLRGLRNLADETIDELRSGARDEESDLRSMADGAGAYDDEDEEEGYYEDDPDLDELEVEDLVEEEVEEEEEPVVEAVSARDELERRLEAARARRRRAVPDDPEDEEPVA